MKTILSPAYLHEYLKIKILKEQNSSYLLDYQFIDLNTLVHQYLGDDTDSLLNVNAAFNIVKTDIFKDILKFPKFKKEVLSFYRLLLKNDIDTSTLPEDTKTNYELKLLLSSLENLQLKENNYKDMLYKLKQQDFSSFEIYEGFTTLEEKTILDILYSKKAIKKDIPSSKGIANVFQCLNMHQEIEAVAQEIIKNNYNANEVNITLCNKDYIKPLQQIFDMYKIPYGLTENKVLNDTNIRFKLLVNLYLENTIENYRKAIINNCFSTSSNKEINQYLKDFVLNFDECKDEFSYYQNLDTTFNKRDLKGLVDLEVQANKTQLEILPKLNSILNSTSLKEALIVIFNILKENNKTSELKILKNKIEDSSDSLDIDNIDLFLECLSDTKIMNNSFSNVVAVTNILKPIPTRNISYILGCDQSSYPNFKIAKGYFDQEYLDKISYYSQSTQYNHYINQIHWIYKSGEIINFYSSIAQYNGKAKSMAFEIDNIKKAKFINIKSNEYNSIISHKLSPKVAKDAFIKDNNIYGSVSSYEKYFNCPYSYFLNYGLKLYPNEIIGLQANTLGTAAHSIFEKVVKEDPKTYGQADYEKISKLTNSYFDQLRLVFRKNKLEITSIQYRLSYMLEKAFKFYLSMEEATSFSATYFEKEVFEKMASQNNINLYIKGYIDRVDTYNNCFRVIDYKSSNQTLTEKNILNGSKLQLVTYTKILKNELGLEPYGSYYAFYKSGKIQVPAYTYSITNKIDFFDEQIKLDEFNKQYKLSGFSYQYDEFCDDSTHIKGIINNKIRGKAILFEQVESAINSLYEHLITQLSQGNIELSPVEGACTYCKYQSICNFRGKKIKNPQQIVDIDLKNKEEQE